MHLDLTDRQVNFDLVIPLHLLNLFEHESLCEESDSLRHDRACLRCLVDERPVVLDSMLAKQFKVLRDLIISSRSPFCLLESDELPALSTFVQRLITELMRKRALEGLSIDVSNVVPVHQHSKGVGL